MASFDEHLIQVDKNLKFLEFTNSCIHSWDWKVTISFYVGVHLINSHLSKFDLHYRSHKEVDLSINPENSLSASKLDEDTYYSYKSLFNLSRRSRYLIDENPDNKTEGNKLTYDKHFKRAIFHLDVIMKYINNKYQKEFTTTSVRCIEINVINDLTYFSKIRD